MLQNLIKYKSTFSQMPGRLTAMSYGMVLSNDRIGYVSLRIHIILSNGKLYTGSTSDLRNRVKHHSDGFGLINETF